MTRDPHRTWKQATFSRAAALSLACLASLACIPPQPPPPARPAVELNLAGAVQAVATDLSKQLGPAAPGSRVVVIDPLLDGRTGQQTQATSQIQQQLAALLPTTMPGLTLIPFDGDGANKSNGVITGSLTALPEPGRYRLSVSLTERRSGLVVSQAAAMFREANLDASPTKFYGDSPSLVRDRSVDGYVRTSETPAGRPADALYVEQLPTAGLLSEALTAYNAEHWSQALTLYQAAAQRPDGQQLRTFNGIYLANMQMGMTKQAEDAFAKIVDLGLATNNLAVKLLFRPGTTEFWQDSKVSGVYPMWLRQVARATLAAGICMNITGHTSRSGSEQVNDRLSQMRATAIREKLQHHAPGLANKLRVSGLGYRENLIGTGADDASDALDRRVEFKVVDCNAPIAPPPPAPPAPAPAAAPAWGPPPAQAPAPAAAPTWGPPPAQAPAPATPPAWGPPPAQTSAPAPAPNWGPPTPAPASPPAPARAPAPAPAPASPPAPARAPAPAPAPAPGQARPPG